MLTVDNQQQIEEILVKDGLIDKASLEKVKQVALEENKPLMTKLLESNTINNEDLTKVIAKSNNVPYVNLTEAVIDKNVLDLLPKDIAERHMAVPLGETNGRLAVAMLDANNVQAVDFLSNKLGRPLTIYMASQEGIKNVLSQYSADVAKDVKQVIGDINTEEAQEKLKEDQKKSGKEKDDADKVKTIVQDSPISRALTTILEYAVNTRASDIHIEPTETELKIRNRIDGVLREVMKLPKTIEPALVSRIKILSSLKIDEHRVPQDGQFKINVAGRDIDLRIAVSPVVWGEQVVIRILDTDNKLLDLEDLGFVGRALRTIRQGISRPHGMVLSSGPTGSGKSTTLYALVNEIKDESINIVTLEDPVEYKMEGVNQIQVNPEVGLTFASGLRSILRQDPDVVLVGEIRDKETARLAVQAALTGHLVFSTVHTNSAAGVLPRLLDMEIEPYLIASTVNTVIGQRLVRRIGDDNEEYKSDATATKSIQDTLSNVLPGKDTKEADIKKLKEDIGYETLPKQGQNAYTLYKGKETKSSPAGYKGRVGIYEVYAVSEEIEKLLISEATSSQIQKQAQAEGMITMKQDGYLKALNGLTTLEEVGRVAADN